MLRYDPRSPDIATTLSSAVAPMCLLLWSEDDIDLFSPGANRSTAALSDAAVRALSRASGGVAGYLLRVDGFYVDLARDLPMQEADAFRSRDGRATIIAFVIDPGRGGPSAGDYAKALDRELQEKVLPPFKHTAAGAVGGQVLGVPAFLSDIQASASRDLAICDGTSVPLALLVLLLVVRSFRLLLVPLLCLCVASAISFGLMFFPARFGFPIMSAAASLMMTILIAMTLDYGIAGLRDHCCGGHFHSFGIS
jgi:MMPL family